MTKFAFSWKQIKVEVANDITRSYILNAELLQLRERTTQRKNKNEIICQSRSARQWQIMIFCDSQVQ